MPPVVIAVTITSFMICLSVLSGYGRKLDQKEQRLRELRESSEAEEKRGLKESLKALKEKA